MAMYRLPGIPCYVLPRVNMDAERVFTREIDNILQYYNDHQLRQRYRFGRRTIEYITRLLENDKAPITNRNHAASATRHVLITLSFVSIRKFPTGGRRFSCWVR